MTQINNTVLPSVEMFDIESSFIGIEVTQICNKGVGSLQGPNRHPIRQAVCSELEKELKYGIWNVLASFTRWVWWRTHDTD